MPFCSFCLYNSRQSAILTLWLQPTIKNLLWCVLCDEFFCLAGWHWVFNASGINIHGIIVSGTTGMSPKQLEISLDGIGTLLSAKQHAEASLHIPNRWWIAVDVRLPSAFFKHGLCVREVGHSHLPTFHCIRLILEHFWVLSASKEASAFKP